MTTLRVVSREPMLPGLSGLGQTEARIALAIRRAARDPEVIWHARQIVSGVPPHEPLRQIRAVFQYLIGPSGFTYCKDPVDVEFLQVPPALPKAGDCDDYVVQGGAYLEALGHPVEVVVMGTRAPKPGETPRYHHVALRVLDENTGIWWPFDPVLHRPTRRQYAEVGDELPHAVERTFRMFTPMHTQMLGGNPLQDFFFWLDPSRSESPLRAIGQTALNTFIPGAGTAAVVAVDAIAAARKAVSQPAAPAVVAAEEPARASTTVSLSTKPLTPQQTAELESKPLSTGAKVAIGAGALVGVGALATGIWAVTKRKKKRRSKKRRVH